MLASSSSKPVLSSCRSTTCFAVKPCFNGFSRTAAQAASLSGPLGRLALRLLAAICLALAISLTPSAKGVERALAILSFASEECGGVLVLRKWLIWFRRKTKVFRDRDRRADLEGLWYGDGISNTVLLDQMLDPFARCLDTVSAQ